MMHVYSYATAVRTFKTDSFLIVKLFLCVSLKKYPLLKRRHSCSEKKEFSQNLFLKDTILYFLYSTSMRKVYD